MTITLQRLKALLLSVPEADKISNREWLSRQAMYRAEHILNEQRRRWVADINHFRNREFT